VSDGEDSGVVTLRRLFFLQVVRFTVAGRFRVTVKDGIVRDVSFLDAIGSGPGQSGGAGVQESGISREEEADNGEEKGELDGLGVALGGVEVHPKWTEEERGEDLLSNAKPSSSESS
jgi:hypothetical protein